MYFAAPTGSRAKPADALGVSLGASPLELEPPKSRGTVPVNQASDRITGFMSHWMTFGSQMMMLLLLLAAGVLYLYRRIYTEVVEALPLDGGAYNCLLNCTRKFDAAFAAYEAGPGRIEGRLARSSHVPLRYADRVWDALVALQTRIAA